MMKEIPEDTAPRTNVTENKMSGTTENSAFASSTTSRLAQTGLDFYFTFSPHRQSALSSSILLLLLLSTHSISPSSLQSQPL